MIYDLHNDLITGDINPSLYGAYLLKAESEGVRAVILAFWTTRLRGVSADMLNAYAERFKRLNSGIELSFAMEDLHFITEETLSLLNVIPLKYAGLTWNGDNALAGGALGCQGLTQLGRTVLKECGRLDITVDTAHLNCKSFYEVLQAHEGRVMNSHCCFDAVCSHPRNLDDRQIEALIERGGIIGLTLERSFLTRGRAGLDDVIRHIEHFTQKFGCDNICIGSDFNGSSPPEQISGYEDFRLVKTGLLKRGYSESGVEKIFYRNAQQFFKPKQKL